jgi:hypothetical protein
MTHRLERATKSPPGDGRVLYHWTAMPFGMGFGELLLILVIVVVVFWATKLPQLGESLHDAERPRLLLQRRWPSRWARADWLLVIAAVALGAGVLANAALRGAR